MQKKFYLINDNDNNKIIENKCTVTTNGNSLEINCVKGHTESNNNTDLKNIIKNMGTNKDSKLTKYTEFTADPSIINNNNIFGLNDELIDDDDLFKLFDGY